jgi:hypothetical protein
MKQNLASTFERAYREWKAYCARPEIAEHSSDAEYINNPKFQAIVELGTEVVPLIISKLKEDPEAHFLIHATERITRKRFSREETDEAKKRFGSPLGNQGYARMWIDWWETESRNRGLS